MQYRDLLEGREYLPEDLYVFDLQMSWTIALTHEYDEDGNNWYLKAS